MKTIRNLLLITLITLTQFAFAQEEPAEIVAIHHDDVAKLATIINKDNINNCYGEYSMLSQAIRHGSKKCFDLLIEKGADVNKVCNDYVPPLMHAAKYGRLEMVKILVAKGANINYKYEGDYQPADGQTPITYAEMFKHQDIADYLRSVKK